MAALPDDPGEAPNTSSSNAQANTRVRRRPRKRNGPPQLQFLTATDPSQFKDENAKRSVRSQAMIQYRYKADQQKRRGKDTPEEHVARQPPAAEFVTPATTGEEPYQAVENPLMTKVLPEAHEKQYLYPSTSAAWWATNPDEGFGEPSPRDASQPTVPTSSRPSRYYRALSAVPLNAPATHVTEYEETDDHEETAIRILVAKLATMNIIGDGVDPFSVIPQFASKEIDSLYLVRKCQRAFVSQETMVRWLPSMLAHPHVLLSSTVLVSTYLDMHAGCSGDSKRTVIVKGETISWINERLRNPDTQFHDFTLMVILHLLAGEMWSCNEKTLRIHESGVARLISHRGGMDCLEGATAEVSAACCFHTDIFCEATPLPIFSKWEPPKFSPCEDSAAIPESPLFCPRSELFTLARDPRCSEFTYDLLCDMRDLTDVFLAYHKNFDTILDVETDEGAARLGLSSAEYNTRVGEIRRRLASRPSAYTPGLAVTNDWLYEACRIASIIYTSAIIMRIPFSVASEPGRSIILSDSASLTNSLAGGHLLSTRLTEALYEVLERSNMESVWGDMSGVLYWICMVGAAAARTPASIAMTQAPRSRSEAYATWVRRCLIMFATRTMILLIFKHPIPVVMAQKRLLKVQELIGTGSSRRLP